MMLKNLSTVRGEKRRMEKAHPGLAFRADDEDINTLR